MNVVLMLIDLVMIQDNKYLINIIIECFSSYLILSYLSCAPAIRRDTCKPSQQSVALPSVE